MGKAKAKGCAKKTAGARRASASAEKANRARLSAAVARRDLFEEHAALRTLSADGLEVDFECIHGSELSEAELAFCLELTRERTDLEGVGEGDDAKREALRDERSRVLLLRGSGEALVAEEEHVEDEWLLVPSAEALSGSIAAAVGGEGAEPPRLLGFAHLQLASERAVPALLVIELHFVPEAQGKGLGEHTMRLVDVATTEMQLPLVFFNGLDVLHAEATAAAASSEPPPQEPPLPDVGFEVVHSRMIKSC